MAILSGVSDLQAEEKESTVQEALLLRNAFTYRAATNKTVIVVANGHVTLTPIADVDVALRFTPQQWSEIVQFVMWRLDGR